MSKSRLNVEQMLKDNHKHSEIVKKYDHLHIKPKEQTIVRSPKGTSEKYVFIHSDISKDPVSSKFIQRSILIRKVKQLWKESVEPANLKN